MSPPHKCISVCYVYTYIRLILCNVCSQANERTFTVIATATVSVAPGFQMDDDDTSNNDARVRLVVLCTGYWDTYHNTLLIHRLKP